MLSTLILSCSINEEKEIDDSYFTPKQYLEVNNILNNFDKKLLFQTQSSLIEEAYIKYSRRMSGGRVVPDRKEFYPSIENLIRLEVFDEIWLSYDSSPDSTTVHLNKPQGHGYVEEYLIKLNYVPTKSFFKLLEKQGNRNIFLQDYSNSIKLDGYCTPRCAYEFPKKILEFDLKNKNHRLIIAIHYLTLAYK